jgi:hypothetical protein
MHRRRRKATARSLHALRHDREYLLGRLPPAVSSQILALLDDSSVSALRLACRQTYLLAAWATHRLVLTPAGLIHYTTVPLPSVYPTLQVRVPSI